MKSKKQIQKEEGGNWNKPQNAQPVKRAVILGLRIINIVLKKVLLFAL